MAKPANLEKELKGATPEKLARALGRSRLLKNPKNIKDSKDQKDHRSGPR